MNPVKIPNRVQKVMKEAERMRAKVTFSTIELPIELQDETQKKFNDVRVEINYESIDITISCFYSEKTNAWSTFQQVRDAAWRISTIKLNEVIPAICNRYQEVN